MITLGVSDSVLPALYNKVSMFAIVLPLNYTEILGVRTSVWYHSKVARP